MCLVFAQGVRLGQHYLSGSTSCRYCIVSSVFVVLAQSSHCSVFNDLSCVVFVPVVFGVVVSHEVSYGLYFCGFNQVFVIASMSLVSSLRSFSCALFSACFVFRILLACVEFSCPPCLCYSFSLLFCLNEFFHDITSACIFVTFTIRNRHNL